MTRFIIIPLNQHATQKLAKLRGDHYALTVKPNVVGTNSGADNGSDEGGDEERKQSEAHV
ncbi:hypothetical protein EDD15DRAFT_2366097 [Pisolithus albus]|nr:hypothetical protein EDD15DRAFT_2366097 [Pisolithus albus]